ncbi:hypothetical protein PG985_013883 [Apiospora marii]|uniref:uncharacterized protein n=1 Tax=Apiospora marii TaxID=335849 RepID=UPI003131EA4C
MPSRRAAPASAAADPERGELSEQLKDILDSKSGIGNGDAVHRAFANPKVWAKLSDEARAEARLDFDCIKVNSDLRVNCRQYAEDHRAGRHETEWLTSSEHAHVNRADGLYDDMRADHALQQFGVPMPGRDKGKEKAKADDKSSSSEEQHQQQNSDQQEVSAPEIVVAQHEGKDNQNLAEEQSNSEHVEDKVAVQTKAAEQETAEQQGAPAEQDPTVQQEAAAQEDSGAEKATVESEQTAGTAQAADTQSEKGKDAEDVTPEASPTTRSGVLRRSKRQTSRSNPISRASSS